MSMTSDRPRGGLALTAFAAVALLLFPASAATVQDNNNAYGTVSLASSASKTAAGTFVTYPQASDYCSWNNQRYACGQTFQVPAAYNCGKCSSKVMTFWCDNQNQGNYCCGSHCNTHRPTTKCCAIPRDLPIGVIFAPNAPQYCVPGASLTNGRSCPVTCGNGAQAGSPNTAAYQCAANGSGGKGAAIVPGNFKCNPPPACNLPNCKTCKTAYTCAACKPGFVLTPQGTCGCSHGQFLSADYKQCLYRCPRGQPATNRKCAVIDMNGFAAGDTHFFPPGQNMLVPNVVYHRPNGAIVNYPKVVVQKQKPDGTWTTLAIPVQPGQTLTPAQVDQMLKQNGYDGKYRYLYTPSQKRRP